MPPAISWGTRERGATYLTRYLRCEGIWAFWRQCVCRGRWCTFPWKKNRTLNNNVNNKAMSTQSSLQHKHKKIHDFVSGLIAGIISVTVCNPLDIARTRLNVLVCTDLFRTHHFINIKVQSTLTFYMLWALFGRSKESRVFTVVHLRLLRIPNQYYSCSHFPLSFLSSLLNHQIKSSW